MNFHAGVLRPAQTKVLRQLSPATSDLQFYLGGGTALAIHFGHRHSVDLDFFTSGKLDPLSLFRELGHRRIFLKQEETESGTLRGIVSGVPVSFMEYEYRMLRSPLEWAELGLRIAAPEDLAAMKLAAIVQRGSKKDFIDIYALIREGYALTELLRLYQEKFHFSEIGHVIIALAYFDDANRERLPKMIWKADWKTIRQTLQKRLDEFV